ncbi:carbohydrate ABC transporter permease [Streptacidiphilus carbonis]|uniref:carbohydrate ABC transporter permease n=1 Tax=Streptacidiphilus carbonis TaxID=105422 RepID=UPI0005A746C2|nr:carbohydrate ABC transporter permease [Streptacidiphilus carbonis]
MSAATTAPDRPPVATPSRRPRQRPARPRSRASTSLTVAMVLMLAYTLVPLLWLVMSSTKNSQSLFSSFGLWFGNGFSFFHNVHEVLTYDNGIYVRWLGNTVLYAVVGAGGAAALAALGGYGLAKYSFRGKRMVFGMVIGAITVPTTALAVPTYLLFSKIGIVNTPWAVIIPALASPFGLYLMRVYALEAVPDSLLEAARIDGASELRTFFTISLRLLAPGFVTVLLFTLVATWNNYFLPLIVLNNPKWFPLTVGLSQWNSQTTGPQTGATLDLYPMVITGSLLAVVPLVVAFLLLQRYWQSGLAAGSVKQ